MPELSNSGTSEGQRKESRRAKEVIVWVAVIALAAATVAAGAVIRGKSYIVVSVLMVIYCMVPFFVSFERRRPQARELVTLAIMCALAVAARAAFVWLPYFKPMAGIIMIAGIAFGASSGFLTGALSALVSNFIFGQGPWTPWQMLSFGLCGFVFGLLAEKGLIPRSGLSWKARFAISTSGCAFIMFIAGPVLDASSLFYMVSQITGESAIAVFIAGFPINCMHGVATFITLLLLANPMLDKLERLRKKYGMLQ